MPDLTVQKKYNHHFNRPVLWYKCWINVFRLSAVCFFLSSAFRTIVILDKMAASYRNWYPGRSSIYREKRPGDEIDSFLLAQYFSPLPPPHPPPPSPSTSAGNVIVRKSVYGPLEPSARHLHVQSILESVPAGFLYQQAVVGIQQVFLFRSCQSCTSFVKYKSYRLLLITCEIGHFPEGFLARNKENNLPLWLKWKRLTGLQDNYTLINFPSRWILLSWVNQSSNWTKNWCSTSLIYKI